eukprot:1162030-Pelagomonas_calceolata.AAC.3
MACRSLAYPSTHRSWCKWQHAWHVGRLRIPQHTAHGRLASMHGMQGACESLQTPLMADWQACMACRGLVNPSTHSSWEARMALPQTLPVQNFECVLDNLFLRSAEAFLVLFQI